MISSLRKEQVMFTNLLVNKMEYKYNYNNNLEKQVALIKKMITKFWKLKNTKIIYGGSVNTKNIDELKKISSINGFLIGGASLDAKNFIDIIKKTIN